MVISELIEKLIKLLKEHGDVPIVVQCSADGYSTWSNEASKVYYDEESIVIQD